MANEGGPIGRANIELGAVTTGLEADLAAAKAKTVKAVTETEKAVADAAPVAVVTEVATKQAAAQTSVAETADKAAKKSNSFTESLKSMTNPARMAVGAINGIIGSFYSVIGLVGGVVGAFAAIGAALNAKQRAAEAANKAITDLNNKLLEIQRNPLPGSFDPDAEATAIRKSFEDRMAAENELYLAKIDAADKAGKKITGETLERERKERMVALQTERDDRLASLRKYQDAMVNKRKADDFIAEQERVRLAKEADEKIAQERRDSIRQLIADYAAVEAFYAERDRARMREQQAQFSQLRNDINGLFNTSQLEVGINRVGSLIQTLIDKVGDNR